MQTDGQTLGTMRPVDVRSFWETESRDFTPWLAKEENIERLGDALDLELDVVGIEKSVGPYFVDILAKDTSSDRYVVIENQLEKTNHDHLGKCITYASFFKASSVVWVAKDFTEEHKAAIEWLNGLVSSDPEVGGVSFYAVEIKLWKIDDSRPALNFEVVARPAITKLSEAGDYSQLSDHRQLQREFWEMFRARLEADKVIVNIRKPRPQYWYDIPLGRSNIHLSNIFSLRDNKIGLKIYIRNAIVPLAYPQLLNLKEQIESEFGEALTWDPNPEKRDKIIQIEEQINVSDKANWPTAVNWLCERAYKLSKILRPILRSLPRDSDAVEED